MSSQDSSNSIRAETEEIEKNVEEEEEASAENKVYEEYRKRRRKKIDTRKMDILSGESGGYAVVHKTLCNDFMYKIGDIVFLRVDGRKYYAQIRILVEDSFSEKYAALIWLLPSTETDLEDGFNAFTFMYGPQDTFLYELRNLTFVMHPPTEYYKRFVYPLPRSTQFSHFTKCKHKTSNKRKH